MTKAFLCSFLVLLLTYCNGQSQELTGFFSHKMDSLDRVLPVAIKRAKPLGRTYLIKVRNQQQFDKINEHIITAINEGRTNIVVMIGAGVFRFHENHISFNELEVVDVSITIKGKNTIITSDDDFSNEGYCLNPWTGLYQADDLIEVADKEKKECFIPFKNSFKNDNDTLYDKVQITQWFKAPIYDIERINQDGIYFIAPELAYVKQFGREEYSVNYDFLYSGKTPRFRLNEKRMERTCTASCFLRFSNATLRSITLQGLCFKGNKEGSALIAMSSVAASSVVIKKCSFEKIRNTVAYFSTTCNVLFDENSISHTSGNELSFIGDCRNVRVTNNSFKECGTGLGNTMCVRCNGAEYYIANNVFCNFGYCAIGVGLWYGHEKNFNIRGIIEHNEIFFTEGYFAHREEFTLMDAGAIYVWTQNDDAIIRYNYIHDYGGMRFNSGIYCDDGASNCKIYGNVILNTPDGCSITSRKANDQKESFRNNAHNFIAGNVIDGPVVFAGYGAEERYCVKGTNYVVKGEKIDGNKFENLKENQPDVEIEKPSIKAIRSKYIKNWRIRE